MSSRFAERRRPKHEVTPQQQAIVDERKDHETESWTRHYIARQDTDQAPWENSGWDRIRGVVAYRLRARAKPR